MSGWDFRNSFRIDAIRNVLVDIVLHVPFSIISHRACRGVRCARWRCVAHTDAVHTADSRTCRKIKKCWKNWFRAWKVPISLLLTWHVINEWHGCQQRYMCKSFSRKDCTEKSVCACERRRDVESIKNYEKTVWKV